MKPWKPEYVELLIQNMEELRHVKFIDNRGRKEDVKTTSTRGSDEKIYDADEKIRSGSDPGVENSTKFIFFLLCILP